MLLILFLTYSVKISLSSQDHFSSLAQHFCTSFVHYVMEFSSYGIPSPWPSTSSIIVNILVTLKANMLKICQKYVCQNFNYGDNEDDYDMIRHKHVCTINF